MAIIINNRNSPTAISCGGHDIREVYVGSHKVWPDENEFYIRIRPYQGSYDWHYVTRGESIPYDISELETGSLCESIWLSLLDISRLKLSDSTKVLGDLTDCRNLTYIDLGNGLERITQPFWAHSPVSLDVTVTLPASIKELVLPLTNWASQYRKFICLATTPPTVTATTAGDHRPFYVPAESFDLYKVAPGWDDLYNRGYLFPIE